MALFHILMSVIVSNRSHPATFTCSNSRTKTQEKGAKYVPKLTMKTPEQSQWHRSDVFVIFKHISHLFLVFQCWLWAGKCLLGRCSAEHKFRKMSQNRDLQRFTERLFYRRPPGDYFCILLWLNMLLDNGVSVLRNICHFLKKSHAKFFTICLNIPKLHRRRHPVNAIHF